MLKPIDIEIDGKKFILTRFTALDGLEIMAHLPYSAPTIGDIEKCLQVVPKIMKYVYVPVPNSTPIALSTKELIENHTSCAEYPTQTMMKLIKAMAEHNFSFFNIGRASTLLDGFALKVQQLLTKILTDSSAQSSQKGVRRSKN